MGEFKGCWKIQKLRPNRVYTFLLEEFVGKQVEQDLLYYAVGLLDNTHDLKISYDPNEIQKPTIL